MNLFGISMQAITTLKYVASFFTAWIYHMLFIQLGSVLFIDVETGVLFLYHYFNLVIQCLEFLFMQRIKFPIIRFIFVVNVKTVRLLLIGFYMPYGIHKANVLSVYILTKANWANAVI